MKRVLKPVMSSHSRPDTDNDLRIGPTTALVGAMPLLLKAAGIGVYDSKLHYLLSRIVMKALYSNSQYVVIHHIDYDKENSSPDNLLFITRTGHGLVHTEKLYKSLLTCFNNSDTPVQKLSEVAHKQEVSMMRQLFNRPEMQVCKVSQLSEMFRRCSSDIVLLGSQAGNFTNKELNSLALNADRPIDVETDTLGTTAAVSRLFNTFVSAPIKFVDKGYIEDFIQKNPSDYGAVLDDDARYAAKVFVQEKLAEIPEDSDLYRGLQYLVPVLSSKKTSNHHTTIVHPKLQK